MATSTLTDVIVDPGGNVVATSPGTTVNFRLMANGSPTPGFRISDNTNVASIITAVATTSGTISQALENNANITPLGTYYVAEILCPSSQGGTQEWALLSSSSASPQTFRQALAATIPSFTPIVGVPFSILSGNNVYTGSNQFNGNPNTFVNLEVNDPAAWIDVRTKGATGNGVTDDTASIQAALNALVATTISSSGVLAGTVTTLFFPAGIYKVTAPLTYSGFLRVVSDGRAIINGTDLTKDIFTTTAGYSLEMRGIILIGGKRQVVFGNNNANTSMVLFERCEFHANGNDFMIDTVPTAPATNLSCNLTMRDCKVVNPYKFLHNCNAVSTRVQDTWFEQDSGGFDGATIQNDNELILDHFYGVPTAASTNKRWIDNYGELKVISCRFGGEGAGGWPIVYNFAAPEQVYPYNLGGMVSIRDSFCSIGPSGAGNRAIVYLATDLPQIIDLQGNYGLTHDAANYIVDGIGGGLTAYLAGINSNVRFYVHIKNNAGWVPLDISGIPASLSGASPLQVHFDVEGSLLPWAVEFDAATSAKTDSNWPGANIAFGGHYEGYFRYSSGAQNASISFQAVLTAGTWSAVLAHTQDSDRGIYTVEVNGASVGTIDGYAAGTTEAVGSVGAIAVTDTGLYSIQLVMATKNVASSNYRGAISHLSMVRTA